MNATELLHAFATRDLSPVEALAECEARIDPELGAFAALCLDRARDEARAAEDAWRRGTPTGPLCGVPIAVKDLFDTAGVETACGSPMLAGRVPDRDAEPVRRVREAGAIVIGKTRTQEYAWGLTMLGRHGEPVTRNPHDPERTPGGSSGGSGAALAAGMAPLALGSDTGGSIRLPAAWCRVVGHKPTFGRVPLDGVWPLAPPLDHAGPMATTVEDTALLLGVLDGTGDRLGEPPGELRVAGPEALPEHRRILAAFRPIFLRHALESHRAAGLWPQRAAEYGPALVSQLERAETVDDAQLAEAHAERERLRADLAAVFDEFDLVRSPVASIEAPRFAELTDLREEVTPWTSLQNLLGLPAVALPDGTQLTGPAGADRLVLAAAAVAAAP
jgi:aspartyl-tRNA(Asn)/glutamyl-tRNA(Gln) amidotransferase subunit A